MSSETVAQLLESLSRIHEALASIPSPAHTEPCGAHLNPSPGEVWAGPSAVQGLLWVAQQVGRQLGLHMPVSRGKM